METCNLPRLALAIAQGHAIFLDREADRYFALSPVENHALIDILAGNCPSERVARAITAAIGHEARADVLRKLMPESLPPAQRLAMTGNDPAPLRARLQAIAHYIAARVRLRVRGLSVSLDRLPDVRAGRPRRSSVAEQVAVSRIAQAHGWLSRHITSHDNCLVSSLALASHLRSAGQAACLVIGVRADPFSAHCWVRWQEVLVEEDSDVVAAFTPILVVR